MGTTQRNFILLAIGDVGSRVLGFAATALLARRLGADGFGVLGLAMAVTSYFFVPGMGLQDLATREVAKRPDDAARLAVGVIRVRLLLAAALLAVSVVIALFFPKPYNVRVVLALSALPLLPLAVNAAWVYKALERSQPIAVSLFVASLTYTASVILFVRDPEHLLRVPLLQTAGEVAGALWLLPVTRGGWRDGSIREGLRTLRGAQTVTIGRYLRSLVVTADVVLLSFMTTDRDVGLYTAAYRVCFLLTAVAASAHVVFIPALTRARTSIPAASAVLGWSLWLAWTVALPLVIGGMIVAPDLLVLLFGESYREAATALRLLLASVGLLFLHGAVRNVLLVNGRLALDASFNAATAALNVGLNLALIPRYGLTAAASVMVLTEGGMLLASAIAIGRWGWRPPLRELLRPSVAVTLMAGALYAMPLALHVSLRVIVAAAVYLAALKLVGALRPDVRSMLARVSDRDPTGGQAAGAPVAARQ